MNIEFNLIEKSKRNKFYILLDYSAADGLSFKPEYIEFEGIDATNYMEADNWKIIEYHIDKFKGLKPLLEDDNITIEQIEEDYGHDMVLIYKNAPTDPMSNNEFKCYLNHIALVYFDDVGNMYRANINEQWDI